MTEYSLAQTNNAWQLKFIIITSYQFKHSRDFTLFSTCALSERCLHT